MLKFAIIAEGATDQTVIENILLGYFQEQEDEPVINYVQPPKSFDAPGGWTNVFKSLERKDYEGALQFNDYLVIHIDADVQEEPGFDVPRRLNGQELTNSQRVETIIVRLRKEIEEDFHCANSHRIGFAIAVDTIECWLLPLLFDDNKAAKTSGCLQAANHALRKANRKGLSAGDKKFIDSYDKASRDYRRHAILMERQEKNPSLELFINQLAPLAE